ncbi:ubiquitin carboxyl-terminal hydrolase 32 isoform X1 [Nilaparvata lugens]|uniref:ubiquitin carboxyl-terminal hydrolase 32 isoform X1 n=1 Tax=Nilaparvata lugens TaxID=108931 RepID=UPI00193D4F5E|nr:ubiquitin carboxyl-terminal hydrolase 32 isoform X1 [Nilaparvata lugens]
MGNKGSKPITTLTYEDAVKRLTDTELKRLRDAFKRFSCSNAITDKVFIREVLGDGVPTNVAEFLFIACGGVPDKGIAWKELLCGLVLLTRGEKEEKYRFVFSLYCNESGTHINQYEFQKTVESLESRFVPVSVSTLFHKRDRVTFDEFREWLKWETEREDGGCISLNKWILKEPCSVTLGNECDSPTFYQTLAGVTHLEEMDIVQLEKRYFALKESSQTGKLDEETLRPLISPPIPLSVCSGVFNAFDENRDNHIDFKEMACGISAATRGPLTERQKFCFKVFDVDRDGHLSEDEMKHMIDVMLFVRYKSKAKKEFVPTLMKELNNYAGSDKGLTVEEYLMWTVDNQLPMDFLNLLFQVCHVVLGLRPVSRSEEGDIVMGWQEREDERGCAVGQFWYLISMEWWTNWLDYVSSTLSSSLSGSDSRMTGSDCSPSGSLKRLRMSKRSLQNSLVENTVALENSSVIVTGITSLECGSNQRSSSSLLAAPFSSWDSPSGSPNQSPRTGRRNMHPGHIDNTSLILASPYKVGTLTGEGAKLKQSPTLVRGRDYELVPDSLWKALCQWYGGSPALPRQVIMSKSSCELELELYPITLRLLRHVRQGDRTNSCPPTSTWSGMVGGYGAAAALIGSTTGYNLDIPNLSPPRRYLAHIATFSRVATIKQVYEFLCDRLHVRSDDMRLWHVDGPSGSMMQLEDETATLEDMSIVDDDEVLIEIRNKNLTWPEEIGNLAFIQSDKCRTAGQTEKGVTGLNNLGNTCFMNAALQCVSNTRILTEYFLGNKHLYELNRSNTMGMRGHLAKKYGDLIQDIWSGQFRTLAPLKLRWTIGKFAPFFTGSQQHDSQELLAFLLDGLHEDLNRVADKPYTVLKESNSRPDVIVAQESWEAMILRNKSIIIDLFYGQLKSSIICNVCGYESVKFEPFNSLSLPLPLESFVHVLVIVIRLNGSVPIQYGLRLNVDATCTVLKNQLSSLSGIPASLLKLVKVADGEIKTTLSDDSKLKDQTGCSESLYAYELPCYSFLSDEERLSINSVKSQREAQTFTAIQRSILPQIVTGSVWGGAQPDNPNNMFPVATSDLESPNMDGKSESETFEIMERTPPPSLGHTDSGNCSASSSSLSDIPYHQAGHLIAVHRKLMRQETYFLSSTKVKPVLFGLPVIVACSETTTHQDLYQAVWIQVARLVTPLPPSESMPLNHAMDCDDSLGYEFPFVLKAVNKNGTSCAKCPWFNFCRGCRIQCSEEEFGSACSYIAIDWDRTALHLRYQTNLEKTIEKHPSVATTLAQQNEPISLDYCMEAFTKEELLTGDEKYHCPRCKEFQLAKKKLQIFRLPPVLIIHLKRFQYVNNRWIKSLKVVNMPLSDFDPTPYLAEVPKETILKHKEQSRCKRKTKTNQKENGSKESSQIQEPLQDFHQHRLTDEQDPFDLSYKLYAVLSHHGQLGNGHYISYALNPNGKWYIYNDSSTKETKSPDTNSAYLLFYERKGLCTDHYMPCITGKEMKIIDARDLIDEYDDSEFRRTCLIM